MTAFRADLVDDFNFNKARVQKQTLDGVSTAYFSVRPGHYCTVMINKGGSTATLKSTNDYTEGANVDDAVFSTLELSSGTDDYHDGHSAGLTGFEVDVTTYVGDCVIIITEYQLV